MGTYLIGNFDLYVLIQFYGFGIVQLLFHIILLRHYLLGLLKHEKLVNHSKYFLATIFTPPKEIKEFGSRRWGILTH